MNLLESMIDQHYQEKQKYDTRPMRKLHPSTIGMCQRRIVFDIMMVPRATNDSQLTRIFENGHSMHHRYEQLFGDMGILVEAERKLETDNISGHTDAVIRISSFLNPHGELYLVELKSAFSKSFKWMKENNVPKTEHRHQLTFYMKLSKIRKGIIFVENKDTQEIWEYHLDYDPVLGEQLMNKANWLIQLARERKLPNIPKGHTPSYYKCAQCPFNIYCHNGSITQKGEERYPIPFEFDSLAYRDVLAIILAINNNQPIPNVIQGETNGDLVREVAERNKKSQTYKGGC